MAGNDRWYFAKELLENTPSRRCGMDADKELSYRQQATNLIQDMGQRLQVAQLCINTAIVYMHRFYMFHSFTKFNRNSIASCALFLAAKVEEQPRKLEHVIKIAHMCLHRGGSQLDIKSEAYNDQAHELVVNENIMLQTLGFDIAVEHPHTWVVKFCDLVRASKDLAQTSYFMATNSLHLTTMCLQYRPTVVACVCIHLAYKWSSWEIPRSTEGKDWFYYIDKNVTLNVIEELTSEFLAILDKCPSRLKQKQSSYYSDSGTSISGHSATNSTLSVAPKACLDLCIVLLNINLQEKKRTTPNKVDQKPKPTSSKAATSESVTHANATANHCPSQASPVMKKLKASITISKPNQQQIQTPEKREALSYTAYKEKKEKEKNAMPQNQNIAPKESSGISFVRDVKIKQEKTTTVTGLSRDTLVKANQSPNVQQPHFAKHTEKQKVAVEEKNKVRVKQEPQSENKTAIQTSVSDSIAGNNVLSHTLFDTFNYGSKLNWDHSLTDGEDSSDMKKEIVSDLKMEFSDNESNQSNSGFNLPSLNLLQDSNTHSNTSQSSDKFMKNNSQQNRNSFMSIFAEENSARDTSLNSNIIHIDNTSKVGNNDYSLNINAILDDEPVIPPMLSPLQAETFVKREPASPSIESPTVNSQNNSNSILVAGNLASPQVSVNVKAEVDLKQSATKPVRSKSPLDESSDTCKSTETSITDNALKQSKLKDKHHHHHHHHHDSRDNKHEKHHKEKHKHKHKHKKEKDKDKHRKEKSGETSESQNDSKLALPKFTLSVPKDRHHDKQQLTPLKLKISKKQLGADESSSERNSEETGVPKLVIPKERISGSSSTGETPTKKRKSSPREASTSREKIQRLDLDKHSSGSESNNVHEMGADNKLKQKDAFHKKPKPPSTVSQHSTNSYPQQSDSCRPGNNVVRREVGMPSLNVNPRKHKRDV